MASEEEWKEILKFIEPKKPEFCPHEPFLKQKLFLRYEGMEALYGGRAGGGKLMPLSELIATPSGFQKLGDLHPGDIVFDEKGRPCVILAESDIQFVQGWEFEFDDGSTVVSNDEHKWLTYDAAELLALTTKTDEWRANRRSTRPSRATGRRSTKFTESIVERNKANPPQSTEAPRGSVRTTQEIVETLYTPRGRKNHAIPTTGALQLPPQQLVLDPYLFGVWLGDGTTNAPSITTEDPEIVAAFEDLGYLVSSRQDKVDNKASTYYFKGQLIKDLRKLNVIGLKRVPHEYLWGSEEQRLALLQGMMDTDGNVNSSSVEFTNKNRELTEAVAQLARSFGWKVKIRTKEAKIGTKSYGDVYTVKFAADRIVFRLPRKAQSQSIATRRTNKFRYIAGATRVDSQPMKCLRVSSESNLFLVTEHFIPTHNSDALLMAALQYVDTPGYSAMIFRNTFSDLALPGALMDRAHNWFDEQDGPRWLTNRSTWLFPSGATITFGYLEKPNDHLRYKGAEFQFIGFDEVTEIREKHYQYLFSRLRKPSGTAGLALSRVPLRVRAASNPAPNWVRRRFIEDNVLEEGDVKPLYIPSGMDDNPFIEQESYRAALKKLDPVERARLERGDWWAEEAGAKFERNWFKFIAPEDVPDDAFLNIVRYWDPASSEPSPTNPDPDWTAGALCSIRDGYLIIHHINRFRKNAGGVESSIIHQAMEDGHHIKVRMEKEGGASGKMTIDHYGRHVLLGFDFDGHPAINNKEARMDLWAGKARRGEVLLVKGPWNTAFLDEAISFGAASEIHDDQLDAVSGAFEVLTGLGGTRGKRVEIIV